MLFKLSKLSLFACFSLYASFCLAYKETPVKHPFYFGFIAGYGSTTWDGLVPSEKKQNDALKTSTPISVEEGGSVWGLLAGYEFTHYFAIEASFINFSEANVDFDDTSIFTNLNDGIETLNTQTKTLSVIGKLMVPIPHSEMKIFSGAGIAGVYRKDFLVDDWNPGPTFTVGANYNFAEHIMGEIAGTFTAGHGESELSPVDSYYPFLYSIAAHLIYRF